jgi:hypothetical protein
MLVNNRWAVTRKMISQPDNDLTWAMTGMVRPVAMNVVVVKETTIANVVNNFFFFFLLSARWRQQRHRAFFVRYALACREMSQDPPAESRQAKAYRTY